MIVLTYAETDSAAPLPTALWFAPRSLPRAAETAFSSTVLGSSRRIFWYWLLLLLPTLAVGGGAILLLKREQTRLASRTAMAEQARRAALEARVQLVAENVELLVGDIQEGLLEALTEFPENDLPATLDRWQKSQPLVRVAFLATPAGALIKPDANAASDEGRGFARRFASKFAQSPPWRATDNQKAQSKNVQALNTGSSSPAQPIPSQQLNVARVQNARREAKTLAKVSAPSASARSRNDDSTTAQASARRMAESDSVEDLSVSPRGWAAQVIGGHLHLLGWVLPAGKLNVRGVELDLTRLVSRLGAALPSEAEQGEGFALRDETMRILHQSGDIPADLSQTTVRLPLSDALFPGWEVVGYATAGYDSRDVGDGFFLVGALLTGILVVAILSGGSLLLWQAKRSEAEAEQKTSFVANVSHEFKTPLTSIRLYSELLEQDRVKDESTRAEYLKTIARETQRLTRLVGNALDFSRLEQGRKKYHLEQTYLSAEVIRIVDTQRPRLQELQMNVQLDLPAAETPVATDRDAFEQILLNLIDNACKYAASGGVLRVQLAVPASGGAELHIIDNGPGVPEDHRDRIFEKFHRVDDALTAGKTGAGLGLSIARQLATGLGGQLFCTNAPQGGAMFVLRLP